MKQIFVFEGCTFLADYNPNENPRDNPNDHENPDDQDKLITITMRCFGARFKIIYEPHNLAISPYLLAQHNKSLSAIRHGWEFGTDEYIHEIHRLKKPFEELMSSLAPSPIPSVNHLSDYLYIPHLILEATAAAENSTEIHPHFKGQLPQTLAPPHAIGISCIADHLRTVKHTTSSEVRLLPTSTSCTPDRHPHLRGPTKVIDADGTICYFKPYSKLIFSPRVDSDKPWIYNQMNTAFETKKLRADIRICRLHSVVIDSIPHDCLSHEENTNTKWNEESAAKNDPAYQKKAGASEKAMLGILLTYITHKDTLASIASTCTTTTTTTPSSLLHRSNFDSETRRLWLGEAEEGSFVPRWPRWPVWVDYEMRDTKEGDLQGVERIKERLMQSSSAGLCFGDFWVV
ncbi:hypothetical protein SBOR_7069 [Sclerotinia borealis F-4128]|uniref:Uncharacterized protein n=1 Tax=Sclerotinia borealis (strain F-4128) TaxID=1432307 RepID=W9C9R8_SCLBF|nr:hypothetical protein SBOR_7069 [Sclerotinia borealis F-4128]